MSTVDIYTDGACRGNSGSGGWGALMLSGDHRKELNGAEPDTTNNRMELIAAIEALAALTPRCQVRLVTDSQYVRQGITAWIHQWKKRDWRIADRKPVKNMDLWQRLDEQIAGHDIEWQGVKGHSDVPGNERADQVTNEVIDAMSTLAR